MKAILNYKNNLENKNYYQIKFVYDNELEMQTLASYLKIYETKKLINSHHTKYKTINFIDEIYITEDILIPFISILITINKINLTIDEFTFNSFDIEKIQESINKLDTNITINNEILTDNISDKTVIKSSNKMCKKRTKQNIK